MLLPLPVTHRLCSWPYAVRSMRSYQSVFAFPSWLTFCGAYCCTAARNCAAFSMSGPLRDAEAEVLTEYSNCGLPRAPDLVWMSTTPFAALAP